MFAGYEATCSLGMRLHVHWVQGYMFTGYDITCLLGTRLHVPGYEATCSWVRGYKFAGSEVITSIPDTLPPCNESENSTTFNLFQPIAM